MTAEDRVVESLAAVAIGKKNAIEAPELRDWVAKGNVYQAVLDLAATEVEFQKELRLYAQADPERAYKHWQEWRDAQVQPKAPAARVRALQDSHRHWISAAIVITILIAGAVLVDKQVWHRRETASPVSPAVAQDTIRPGKNTAMLTLSNGREILLDSASPGELATETNARVVKTDSGVVYLHNNKSTSGLAYNTLATSRSGQYQLTLPDGSRVWLNDSSSLRYPTSFDGKERTVELTGEAYFEVVKIAAQPFIVKLDHKQAIEAIGTSFNIMAYPGEDQTKTTLLSGNVQVTTPKRKITLKPMEQAGMDSAGELTVVKGVPGEEIISWKNGFFYFGHTTLQEVMRQLARWYDVEVDYRAGRIDVDYEELLTRDHSLNYLVKFFNDNNIDCRLEGRKLIVLP